MSKVETIANNLEALADVEIPPPIWAGIMSATANITHELFKESSVCLRVMSDAAVRQLNHDYRNIDEHTDVLSFTAADAGDNHAGDIALSWDAVLRQAEANGNTPLTEAIALITHGLLHLAGWDHATDATAAAMDEYTRSLCNQHGVTFTTYGH